MGFDENIEMVRLAFYQVLISSGPFLGAALAIGALGSSARWRARRALDCR